MKLGKKVIVYTVSPAGTLLATNRIVCVSMYIHVLPFHWWPNYKQCTHNFTQSM